MCKTSNAKPIVRELISTMCYPHKSLEIVVERVKFNEPTVITCKACYYTTTMYLWRLNKMLNFQITMVNDSYNNMQQIGNIYYYHFNYTSLNNDRYVACVSGYISSLYALVEGSNDTQLILYAWRKKSVNLSFPDRSDKYEFIIYVETNFRDLYRVTYELSSSNYFMFHHEFDYLNTFKRAITISSTYNMYTFYIRVYAHNNNLNVNADIEHINTYRDTYVGFAKVLDYDDDAIKYITREAKHIEL